MIKNKNIQKLIKKYLLNTTYACPLFFHEPTYPVIETKENAK